MQLIEGALTNSLVVAEVFKKEHGEIVRTIEELEAVVIKESGDTTMFRRSSYEAGGRYPYDVPYEPRWFYAVSDERWGQAGDEVQAGVLEGV